MKFLADYGIKTSTVYIYVLLQTFASHIQSCALDYNYPVYCRRHGHQLGYHHARLPRQATTMPDYCHTRLPQCQTTATPDYHNARLPPHQTTTMPDYCHTRLAPCQTTTTPDYSHTRLLPYQTTTMADYCHTRLPQCQTTATPAWLPSCQTYNYSRTPIITLLWS